MPVLTVLFCLPTVAFFSISFTPFTSNKIVTKTIRQRLSDNYQSLFKVNTTIISCQFDDKRYNAALCGFLILLTIKCAKIWWKCSMKSECFIIKCRFMLKGDFAMNYGEMYRRKTWHNSLTLMMKLKPYTRLLV